MFAIESVVDYVRRNLGRLELGPYSQNIRTWHLYRPTSSLLNQRDNTHTRPSSRASPIIPPRLKQLHALCLHAVDYAASTTPHVPLAFLLSHSYSSTAPHPRLKMTVSHAYFFSPSFLLAEGGELGLDGSSVAAGYKHVETRSFRVTSRRASVSQCTLEFSYRSRDAVVRLEGGKKRGSVEGIFDPQK